MSRTPHVAATVNASPDRQEPRTYMHGQHARRVALVYLGIVLLSAFRDRLHQLPEPRAHYLLLPAARRVEVTSAFHSVAEPASIKRRGLYPGMLSAGPAEAGASPREPSP